MTRRKNCLVGPHLGITPRDVTNILTEAENERAEVEKVREGIDEKRGKLQVCP